MYTVSQVIFTILFAVLGGWLLFKAYKLRENGGSKALIVVFSIIGVLLLLGTLGQLISKN